MAMIFSVMYVISKSNPPSWNNRRGVIHHLQKSEVFPTSTKSYRLKHTEETTLHQEQMIYA